MKSNSMKALKAKEIRAKTDAELQKDMMAFREQMRTLRFKLSAQESKNLREIAAVRKNVAKILTILKERSN